MKTRIVQIDQDWFPQVRYWWSLRWMGLSRYSSTRSLLWSRGRQLHEGWYITNLHAEQRIKEYQLKLEQKKADHLALKTGKSKLR